MSTVSSSSRVRRAPLDYGAFLFPGLLILSSVVAATTFSIVASRRPLTTLEAVLLQFITLLLGLAGSFISGQQSASAAARQMVKPHARSAFRRVLFLYLSLGRLARAIERARPAEPVGQANTPSGLDMLEAIVAEQIWTANDALEDWRDLIPEDVEEVERRIAARQAGGVERVSND